MLSVVPMLIGYADWGLQSDGAPDFRISLLFPLQVQQRAAEPARRYNDFDIVSPPLSFARVHDRRRHSAGSRGLHDAARCSVIIADRRTFGFGVSKLGLQATAGCS